MEKAQELINTIKDKNETREYVTLDEGEHTMGLVGIKNIVIESKMYGTKKDGYQLTLRSVLEPKGFVNFRFAATTDPEKGKMFKFLRAMTGFKLKKGSTKDEMFNTLTSLLGKWFTVMLEHNKVGDVTYVNIIEQQIIPAPEANSKYGDAIKFFDTLANTGEKQVNLSYEDQQRLLREGNI